MIIFYHTLFCCLLEFIKVNKIKVKFLFEWYCVGYTIATWYNTRNSDCAMLSPITEPE